MRVCDSGSIKTWEAMVNASSSSSSSSPSSSSRRDANDDDESEDEKKRDEERNIGFIVKWCLNDAHPTTHKPCPFTFITNLTMTFWLVDDVQNSQKEKVDFFVGCILKQLSIKCQCRIKVQNDHFTTGLESVRRERIWRWTLHKLDWTLGNIEDAL